MIFSTVALRLDLSTQALTTMAKKSIITSVKLDTEKMKRIRLEKDLTMAQCADVAGLGTRQRWYQIESGEQTNIELATLNAIAGALGVPAKELLI